MSMIAMVLDTETTGFSPEDDRVIEVAASPFDLQTGELIDEPLHLYMNPQKRITAKIQQLTGLSNARLDGEPLFKEVAPIIAQYVRGANLIIHNASFDVRMLNAEFKRAEHSESFEALPASVRCSNEIAKILHPERETNLDAVCDHYRVDRTKREVHSALIDIELLARVFPFLARAEAAQLERLQGLLPFSPGAALPEDVDQLVTAHFELERLRARLKAEQSRIETKVDQLQQGQPMSRPGAFEILYKAEGPRTDWKGIVAAHLPGVDVKPFQTPGGKKKLSIVGA